MRFYGNVTIGTDLTAEELRGSVDAVIYAFGAGSDKRLGIDGEDLSGSVAAAEFVAWYCGHPDVHPDSDGTSPHHSTRTIDRGRADEAGAGAVPRAWWPAPVRQWWSASGTSRWMSPAS